MHRKTKIGLYHRHLPCRTFSARKLENSRCLHCLWAVSVAHASYSVLFTTLTVSHSVSVSKAMGGTDLIIDLSVLGARALGAQRRSTVPISWTHVAIVCVFALLQTMMNPNAAATQGFQLASVRLLPFMQVGEVLPQLPQRLELRIRVHHDDEEDALEADQDGAAQKQPSVHGFTILTVCNGRSLKCCKSCTRSFAVNVAADCANRTFLQGLSFFSVVEYEADASPADHAFRYSAAIYLEHLPRSN